MKSALRVCVCSRRIEVDVAHVDDAARIELCLADLFVLLELFDFLRICIEKETKFVELAFA